jgi:hypothetical protein
VLAPRVALSFLSKTKRMHHGGGNMKKNINAIIKYGLLLTICLVGISGPAWAKKPINTNWTGLALKGYDTVAYFTQGKPVKGSKAFEYKWRDAKWRFSTAKHLDMFKADPEKYAPQYGGY